MMPGGKPVIAVPGLTPMSPSMMLGPVLVNAAPAIAMKAPLRPRVIGAIVHASGSGATRPRASLSMNDVSETSNVAPSSTCTAPPNDALLAVKVESVTTRRPLRTRTPPLGKALPRSVNRVSVTSASTAKMRCRVVLSRMMRPPPSMVTALVSAIVLATCTRSGTPASNTIVSSASSTPGRSPTRTQSRSMTASSALARATAAVSGQLAVTWMVAACEGVARTEKGAVRSTVRRRRCLFTGFLWWWGPFRGR